MKQEVQEWFDVWWKNLPKHHFTSNNKGSRAECVKEIEKLNPDNELRNHIDWYTRELTLRTAKMKSANIKVAGWKHAVRLIRYRFFEDDLPSVASEKERVAASLCQCGNKTGWKDLCWDCYDKINPNQAIIGADELKQRFIDNGLFHDETKAERTERCRQFAVPRLRAILGGGRQANGVGEVHGK